MIPDTNGEGNPWNALKFEKRMMKAIMKPMLNHT